MVVISYSVTLSGLKTYEQSQIDSSKTNELVRVCTDGETELTKSTQFITLIISRIYTLEGLQGTMC